MAWAKSLHVEHAPAHLMLWPLWSEDSEVHVQHHCEDLQKIRKYETFTTIHFGDAWRKQCGNYRKRHDIDPYAAQTLPLDTNRIHLHATMAKAESFLTTQLEMENEDDRVSRFPASAENLRSIYGRVFLWMANK